jgi:hypothetical protein
MLVPPTPEGLAQGAFQLLHHPESASLMGLRGQQFADEHYSWPVFLERATQVQREFASESIVPLSDESEQEMAQV